MFESLEQLSENNSNGVALVFAIAGVSGVVGAMLWHVFDPPFSLGWCIFISHWEQKNGLLYAGIVALVISLGLWFKSKLIASRKIKPTESPSIRPNVQP